MSAKIIVIGGVIGVVIGGVIVYQLLPSDVKEKIQKFRNNPLKKLIFFPQEPNTTQPEEKQPKKSLEKNQYNLLLIIPADKLKTGLTINDEVDKNGVHKLLQFTKRAYCFSEGNTEGETVINALKLSDEKIDITSSRNVFVQIQLNAFSGIQNESIKLQIQKKIPKETTAKVIQVKILQEMRTTKKFYELT